MPKAYKRYSGTSSHPLAIRTLLQDGVHVGLYVLLMDTLTPFSTPYSMSTPQGIILTCSHVRNQAKGSHDENSG